MSVFCENDSRRLSNFLQTHIFWNFDHICRIYNQINYRNIWFLKVIMILIMTAQAVFFNDFSEKDPHLNAVEVWAWACAIARHSRPGMASVIHKKNKTARQTAFLLVLLVWTFDSYWWIGPISSITSSKVYTKRINNTTQTRNLIVLRWLLW